MRRLPIVVLVLALAALLFGMASPAGAQDDSGEPTPSPDDPKVLVAKVSGLLDPVLADFIESSIHTAEEDGASVYVRGAAARRGIGTALFHLAEQHARAHGATAIHIQASLAGVEFYKKNGFEETGRGEATLPSGQSMPCVFMRKRLNDL